MSEKAVRVSEKDRRGCTVIRAVISGGLYKPISKAQSSLIIGITGKVYQVLTAVKCNRLGPPCFCMSGYK